MACVRFLILTLLLSSLPAFAASRISNADLRCIFQKPLEIGASVTGKLGQTLPVLGLTEYSLFGVTGADYRSSPSEQFILSYRKEDKDYFRNAYFRPKQFLWQNLSSILTRSEEQTGTGQVQRLLDGDRKENFKNSSIVLGVDLFYWDAIFDLCGYGIARMRMVRGSPVRTDTEFQMERLIEAAQKSGKILFLGTLPHENPDLVKINSETSGIPGFWRSQSSRCVESINYQLRKKCTPEKNCFLMEFEKLAKMLNEGKKLHVKSENKDIGLYEARPDGVHLSYLGSKYAAEQMRQAFEVHAPRCPTRVEESGTQNSAEDSSDGFSTAQ